MFSQCRWNPLLNILICLQFKVTNHWTWCKCYPGVYRLCSDGLFGKQKKRGGWAWTSAAWRACWSRMHDADALMWQAAARRRLKPFSTIWNGHGKTFAVPKWPFAPRPSKVQELNKRKVWNATCSCFSCKSSRDKLFKDV